MYNVYGILQEFVIFLKIFMCKTCHFLQLNIFSLKFQLHCSSRNSRYILLNILVCDRMDNCVLVSARYTPHKYCVLVYKLFIVFPANL